MIVFPGDCGSGGSCFYKSVAYLVFGNANYWKTLKKLALLHIQNNQTDYQQFYVPVRQQHNNLEQFIQYHLFNDREWRNQLTMFATANLKNDLKL